MAYPHHFRSLLYPCLLWGTIGVSLGFGQIKKDLSAGLWTGIETERILGRTSFGLWTGYNQEPYFLFAIGKYTYWEEYHVIEGRDYGYQYRETLVPQQWTGAFCMGFHKGFWHIYGGCEIHHRQIGQYESQNIVWHTSLLLQWQEWRGNVGYSSREVYLEISHGIWFLQCFWQWYARGEWSTNPKILAGLWVWERSKELGIGYEIRLYQTYEEWEIARILWEKKIHDLLFYGEIGLSYWDSGRIQIGIGKKW
ncbi:MAG: hypothetical protein N2314_07250 [Brevinematales bacterium]|nr:hypothetical protein [Brevinematales bacterium]